MTNTEAAPVAQPKRRKRRVRRALFWIADGMLVGLLVAAYAAYSVSPDSFWWLQFIAIFNGVLVAATGLVAIGAALARRWRVAAFHAFLGLIVVLMPELRKGPEAAAIRPDAPGLTVMTFNASIEHAGAKQEALAEVLARDQPHLVALQEFSVRLIRDTGVTMGAPLLGPLLKDRAYEMSRPGGGKDFMFSRPLFSRIEAAGRSELLAGNPPVGLWSAGGITRRLYLWQGRTIAVYNVHLHSFSSRRPWREADQWFSMRAWRDAIHAYRRDFEVRAEQARQLRQILDAETHPFIVCGDLNSTSRNWVYAHLTRGLRDAFRDAGTGWGGTFPARVPIVRIDHILASREWAVRSARVDTDLVSDHRAVIAELVLADTEEAQQGAE